MMNNKKDHTNYNYVYLSIKNKILDINPNIQHVISTLVNYLYGIKKAKNKTTLWECFGDILVENIRKNVKEKYIYCEKCNILVEKNNKANSLKYCGECFKKQRKEQSREKALKYYYKNNL